MIKIRNAVGVHPDESKAFTGPDSSRIDDIAFIQKLVARTVLPRHFILDKGAEKFEFIAQNKSLVAYKVSGAKNSVGALKGFRVIDLAGDMLEQNDAVRMFVNDFGQLGDNDLLTIKRIKDDDRTGLPAAGIDLGKIDFAGDAAEVKEPKLRVVVNNERGETVKAKPIMLGKPVSEADVIAKPEAPVDPVLPVEPVSPQETAVTAEPMVPTAPAEKMNDILAIFYDRLKAHASYAALVGSDGSWIKKHGDTPEFATDMIAGLVTEFGTWNDKASAGIGAEPKLTILGSGKIKEDILISVVDGDQMVIAQAEFMKLGRVLMGWNALIAARADQ